MVSSAVGFSLFTLLVISCWLTPSATENKTVCVEWDEMHENHRFDIECKADKKDRPKQIKVVSVEIGRSDSSSCPVEVHRHDCIHTQYEYVRDTRLKCNTRKSCPFQLKYLQQPQCLDRSGKRYINVAYDCVKGYSPEGRAQTIIDPMVGGKHLYNGTQLVLQSKDYPQTTHTLNEAIIQIKFKSNVKIKIEILDMFFLEDESPSPFCMNWYVEDEGRRKVVKCAMKVGLFHPEEVHESTTISFDIRGRKEPAGRFWIIVTAYQREGSGYGQMEVIAMDGPSAANASSLTGSRLGDIVMFVILALVILILLIVIIALIIFRRRRRRQRRASEIEPPGYHKSKIEE